MPELEKTNKAFTTNKVLLLSHCAFFSLYLCCIFLYL